MLRRLLLVLAFLPVAASAATEVNPLFYRSWSGPVQLLMAPPGATTPTLQRVVTMWVTIDASMKATGVIPEEGCRFSGIAFAAPSTVPGYATAGVLNLDVTMTGCTVAGFNRRYFGGDGIVGLWKDEVAVDFTMNGRDLLPAPQPSMNYQIRGAMRAAETAPSFVPVAGMWWNPAESGTGYNIQADHNVLVMTVYSYNPDGSAQWYLAAGPLTNDDHRTFSGTLDTYRNGQCISCAYTGRPAQGPGGGVVTIRFTSAQNAVMTLPGGRVVDIVPYVY